jgi:hypothetical protein
VDKLYATVVQVLNNPEMKAMLARQLMAVNVGLAAGVDRAGARGNRRG